MALPYDFEQIETRWRERWHHEAVGTVDLDRADPDNVFYNLVEFPYPSAEGLHVGHVFKYSGVDVFGRFQRMRGRDVFQPIGFDAFGIHAENYALKVGRHPASLTAATTGRFTEQLQRTGMAFDWKRTVDTSRPDYYRWTQWLLVQMFRAGLLYQAEAPVVWCPSCLTVLAREQTEKDGTECERCSTPIVTRVMTQWFLRMTAYADRLLDGFDALDWPERAKRMQRQWIGRHEGYEVDCGDLVVFTTRLQAIGAATFIAVDEQSPLVGGSRPHPVTGRAIPIIGADTLVEDFGMRPVLGAPECSKADRLIAAAHGVPTATDDRGNASDAGAPARPAMRSRMRDWLISRQRYWGPPIPIIHCPSCGPVPVPENDLPVLLPDVPDVRPTGGQTSPLAAAVDWVEVTCPDCGGAGRRETDVSDNFVDSAWYYLRYPSTDFEDCAWDDDRTKRILPVDFYAGGPEHVQRHHLYARFIAMALHDMGLIPFQEPFPRVRLGGMIVRDGAKMSKSRGNVVSPDDYIDAHGADVLRCALLFSAPWEQGGDFSDDAIAGIERFFARTWRVVTGPDGEGPAPERLGRTVAEVTEAIERFSFNVAIARLMELVSEARSAAAKRVFVLLLAPLAPHLAEEMWHRLGEPFSVHTRPWPEVAAPRTAGDIEIPVQVDGRLRGTVVVSPDADEAAVVSEAQQTVAGVPPSDRVSRVIYVPGRVVNFVEED
jgi:leucyl-tRNA synthetase